MKRLFLIVAVLCSMIVVGGKPAGAGAAVSQVTLSEKSESVTGGGKVSFFLKLTSNVDSDTVFTVSSDDEDLLTVPETVTVKATKNSVLFSTTSHATAADTEVTVTVANLTWGTDSASTTVLAPKLNSISMASKVVGGLSTNATITLTGAAPAGGWDISLSVSDTDNASVPASITIAEGKKTGTVKVVTGGVAGDTSVVLSACDENGLSLLAVTCQGVSKSKSFTIVEASLSAVAPKVSTVNEGSDVKVTLTLNAKTVEAYTVSVYFDGYEDDAVSVTIAAGKSTKTVTIEAPSVSSDSKIRIMANPDASGHATKASAKIKVKNVPAES